MRDYVVDQPLPARNLNSRRALCRRGEYQQSQTGNENADEQVEQMPIHGFVHFRQSGIWLPVLSGTGRGQW